VRGITGALQLFLHSAPFEKALRLDVRIPRLLFFCSFNACPLCPFNTSQFVSSPRAAKTIKSFSAVSFLSFVEFPEAELVFFSQDFGWPETQPYLSPSLELIESLPPPLVRSCLRLHRERHPRPSFFLFSVDFQAAIASRVLRSFFAVPPFNAIEPCQRWNFFTRPRGFAPSFSSVNLKNTCSNSSLSPFSRRPLRKQWLGYS